MLQQYIMKNGKKMRCGYTTGSCATAASKAAAIMLFSGQVVSSVVLETPKGITIEIPVLEAQLQGNGVTCAVQKDSGDDPDVTNGMLLYARVEKIERDVGETVQIDGGTGIGRVTRPGLDQPVGSAAINSTPRACIKKELEDLCEEYGYQGGLSVAISAPEGEIRALKTYNKRLGILGGISVLGTSGIVEPMSEDAIVDTIYVQIDVRHAAGDKYLLLTPGNYGQDFIDEKYHINGDVVIKCSNYIGKAIDYAYEKGFEGVLVIGHAGKILKLGCGMFQTHSKYGDCRAEVLACYAALYGASADCVARILNAVTSEEMIAQMQENALKENVLNKVVERILFHLSARMYGEREVGVLFFTQNDGILGQSENVEKMLEEISRVKS